MCPLNIGVLFIKVSFTAKKGSKFANFNLIDYFWLNRGCPLNIGFIKGSCRPLNNKSFQIFKPNRYQGGDLQQLFSDIFFFLDQTIINNVTFLNVLLFNCHIVVSIRARLLMMKPKSVSWKISMTGSKHRKHRQNSLRVGGGGGGRERDSATVQPKRQKFARNMHSVQFTKSQWKDCW